MSLASFARNRKTETTVDLAYTYDGKSLPHAIPIMYEELRKHPRVSLQTELWIGQDGIFTRTDEYLRDLSVGGAFVQSRQVYPIGSIVNLRFKIPGASNLASCTAIVRNMQFGDGFGVQFLDLSGDNFTVLQRQIDTMLAKASES